MVPDRSHDSAPRTLSPELTDALRGAFAAAWRSGSPESNHLPELFAQAAVEARQRSLRAEELLLALKAIELEVLGEPHPRQAEARERFRRWLVTACVQAYFGA